jgi:hypothetical protein
MQRTWRLTKTNMPDVCAIICVMLLCVLGLHLLFAPLAAAAPSGAQLTNNMSSSANTTNPGSRNDSGGTITTMLLSSTQQDTAWKGYLGNVSGSLTLDDASGATIYNWALSAIQGKVFASRSNTVSWGSINCSNQSHIDAEQTVLSFTSADSDSINRTFNSTNHVSFLVNSRNMSNCRSTATYVNDSVQGQVPSAVFPEVLLSDGTNFVYTTIINSAKHGYSAQLMDFQMIVPQNKTTSTPTTYYFYVELS